MSDHEQGYRAAYAGNWAIRHDDHFSGVRQLEKSDEWFNGYRDYLDDIGMGNGLMYGMVRK